MSCGGGSDKPNVDAGDGVDGPVLPKCMDGIDNDSDGKIDFPNDPGCPAANADSEDDDCPSGPQCPQCANGIDDDVNGQTDFPNDTGCTSAADNDESTPNPNACGAGLTIKQLPASGDDLATFDTTSTSNLTSPCIGDAGPPAFAYQVHVTKPTVIVASTDNPSTNADTIIDIRSASCMDAASEVACNDEAPGTFSVSTVTASVPAGIYYIVVSGYATTEVGNTYMLHVDLLNGEGQACSVPADCGPGLVCRIPMGGTMMVCSKPMCSDGVDDDGDTKNDYPTDPGCTSADDNDETDSCPGAGCPACANGVDDDGDTLIDYPLDPGCVSASGNSEVCAGEMDPITALTMGTTNDTLVGAHDDHVPACGSDGGVDRLFTLTVPAMRSLVIDSNGSVVDTVVSLLPGTCAEPSLACSDDGLNTTPSTASLVEVDDLAAGSYVVAVDAYDSTITPDAFTLHVAGVIAPGGKCDPAYTLGGALHCAAANPCTGAVGSKICRINQCSDGVDNDMDGHIDFPTEPGCTDPDDNTEADTCPSGANCPACSNGVDNDADTFVDYAADMSCWAASATTEAFCNLEGDRVNLIVDHTTTGDTTTLHDNLTPACSSLSTAPDAVFALRLPVAVATLTIDTAGSSFDTVLSLHNSTCATSLFCDDDTLAPQSELDITNLAAGNYAIIVDGYDVNAGPFTLHVSGTVATGAACTSPLFGRGVLNCPTGTTCTGGTCH
jgi:hypothetical protein